MMEQQATRCTDEAGEVQKGLTQSQPVVFDAGAWPVTAHWPSWTWTWVPTYPPSTCTCTSTMQIPLKQVRRVPSAASLLSEWKEASLRQCTVPMLWLCLPMGPA